MGELEILQGAAAVKDAERDCRRQLRRLRVRRFFDGKTKVEVIDIAGEAFKKLSKVQRSHGAQDHDDDDH